ncbi:YdcF family protein [Leptothoe sp. PORK10 BA2]|uniref:YdcF family protein n=1 Tax=Leptothoe sp. PORK10 BA2 TaxID=3110254 RepID=UPI002B1F7F73|nr:YdcF family protein [Leptothoe sp. PORK10 BA2]MEA5466269.1 YdcF family protein [Leptothoe sp. PORK10 BA2]
MSGIKLLQRYFKSICLGLLITGVIVTFVTISHLWSASKSPTDAYLVLGGSIRREMYMAQVASTLSPPPPILISAGSSDPCIRLLFEQVGASLDRVWLEHCAKSTFGNFVYSVPLLERWGAHHVSLVTSGSHTRRALTLARILFGARGIWVEPLIVEEAGIPGNQESVLKTTLDIGRSLLWAVVAQVHKPTCQRVVSLAAVDLAQWRQQGFKCEHQAGIEGS